jgi:hypothetical protein
MEGGAPDKWPNMNNEIAFSKLLTTKRSQNWEILCTFVRKIKWRVVFNMVKNLRIS